MKGLIGTMVCTLALLNSLSGQPARCPKIPDRYQWNTARDYKREEELVLRTLQWLAQTPLNHELELRSKANLFVMEWICGSPRLEVNIDSNRLPFYEEYPDLLFPYIHGIALCKLNKNEDCSELQAMVEGFNVVAFMIQSDPGLKKQKVLHPIAKARKRGTMEAFVSSLMSNQP